MSEADEDDLKHQLSIHLDYPAPLGDLEIRYSYPFSSPPLPEQIVRVPRGEVPAPVAEALDQLVEALQRRIGPPQRPRLPSGTADVRVRRTGMTVVIQDQLRAADLPLARMYYLEEVPAFGSSTERAVRMERPDFTAGEYESWSRLRGEVKGMVWRDYKARPGIQWRPPRRSEKRATET